MSYLNADLSKKVDERLMQEPGFTIDQLMELAGYSVAAAAVNFSESFTAGAEKRNVLIVCGPGNNGGDGLVAARHLKQFGYFPSIVYPKQSKGTLFANLVQQMSDLDIPVSNQMPSAFAYEDNAFIVDALFGFSFQGPAREPFASMIKTLSVSSVPVLSVDVPSGWHVEQGDVHGTGFVPHATISLTCPKLCMQGYEGVHYVGGRYAYILHCTALGLPAYLLTDCCRFVPPKIAQELGITLPDYGFNSNQVLICYSLPYLRVSSICILLQFSNPFPPCPVSQFLLLSPGASTAANQPQSSQGAKEAVSAMFVTASSQEEARRIAGALLERRLAACVNLVPQVQSVYMWEGRVETSQEVIMMIKVRYTVLLLGWNHIADCTVACLSSLLLLLLLLQTRASLVDAVSAAVKQLHSYDLPESIALEVSAGSAAYLDWVRASTAPAAAGTEAAINGGATLISADELPYMQEGVTDAGAV